jgi:hypothetical protein
MELDDFLIDLISQHPEAKGIKVEPWVMAQLRKQAANNFGYTIEDGRVPYYMGIPVEIDNTVMVAELVY